MYFPSTLSLLSILAIAFSSILVSRILWIKFRKDIYSRRLAKKGIETEAVILQSDKSALCKKNLREMNIRLQVVLNNGRSFITETKEMLHFTDSHILYPGRRLRVKYDPSNLHEVMILKN